MNSRPVSDNMSRDWAQARRFTDRQYHELLAGDGAKTLFMIRKGYERMPPRDTPRLVAIGNKVVYSPCAYTPVTDAMRVENTRANTVFAGMYICDPDVRADLDTSTNAGRIYEVTEKVVALMFDPRRAFDGGVYLVYASASLHNDICRHIPNLAMRLAALYPGAKAAILAGNLHVQYGDRPPRIFGNITSLFTSSAGFVNNLFLMTSYILCGAGTPHTVILDPYDERAISAVRVEPARLVLHTQKRPTDLEYILNLITSPLFWGQDDNDTVLCYRFIDRSAYNSASDIKKKRKLVKQFDRSEANQPGYGALVIKTNMAGVRKIHAAAVNRV